MRKWMRYWVALAVTVMAFIAIGRASRERDEEPRVRELDAEATRDVARVRVAEARLRSLWTEGRFVECLAPALYKDSSAGARLGGALQYDSRDRLARIVAPTPAYVSVRRGANSPGLHLAGVLAV
jgi:hypothetical protein